MSSYVYISSDANLPAGSTGDEGLNLYNTTFYLSLDSLESFFFKENYDPDEKRFFSYSKHFTSETYQVASIDLSLPEQKGEHLSRENKKALQELFSYIKNHFEHTIATYVEVLFCLNGQENEHVKQRHSIHWEELSINDLYYEEHKFLTIEN